MKIQTPDVVDIENACGSYDVIILGTGLKESLLRCLLYRQGLTVLNIDRSNCLGGPTASMDLEALYRMFKKGETMKPELGTSSDYKIDLTPKFFLNGDAFANALSYTGIKESVELNMINSCFMLSSGKLIPVPMCEVELLKSPISGTDEGNR